MSTQIKKTTQQRVKIRGESIFWLSVNIVPSEKNPKKLFSLTALHSTGEGET